MFTLTIKTSAHQECIDITDDVQGLVRKSGVKEGICHVYVPHATAAIVVNENADPNIQKDFLTHLNKIFPK